MVPPFLRRFLIFDRSFTKIHFHVRRFLLKFPRITTKISLKKLLGTGCCSTLTLLLVCSSFSRENGHPLLICSSLSTAQGRNTIIFVVVFAPEISGTFITANPGFQESARLQGIHTFLRQEKKTEIGSTPPKFNMAPENGWLEDDPFLLGPGNFSGANC